MPPKILSRFFRIKIKIKYRIGIFIPCFAKLLCKKLLLNFCMRNISVLSLHFKGLHILSTEPSYIVICI